MLRLKFALLGMVILAVLISSGCASKTNRHMSNTVPASDYVPKPDKALFIFERENSSIAWPYNSYVWDATDKAEPKIVGYFGRGMRAAYYVDPGEHVFFSTFQGQVDLLKANVEANKTYFVFMEMKLASGLHFDAIRAGEENPIEMDNIGVPVPKLIEWSKDPKNKNNAISSLNKANIRWSEMTEEERNRRTIVPADGR